MPDDEFTEETSEDDVYSEDAREGLTDDAEITPQEEAFMQGYDSDEKDEKDKDDKEKDDKDELDETLKEEDE